MAARIKYFEHTFASTAPVKLTTLLGLSGQDFVSTIALRAKKNNVGDVAWGASNLTISTNRGGFLDAGDAVAFDLVSKYFGTDEMYLVGETNDVVFITWIQ